MNDNDEKLYEVSFLAKSENGAATMIEHLTRFGAEILNEGNLKKMKLAYPIEKEESAYFGSMSCKLPRDTISKISDAVKLDKEIMRILILDSEPIREKTEEQSLGRAPNEPTRLVEQKPTRRVEQDDSVISNELLEEKLEEILQ